MAHLFHVADINNWKATDELLPDYRAWLRADLYLRLDILLLSSQSWHEASRTITEGDVALRRLVSLQTSLSDDCLSQLSFSELLLILRTDLEAVNTQEALPRIPPHVAHEIEALQPDPHELLPPCSVEEWNYSLLMRYQGTYNPQ